MGRQQGLAQQSVPEVKENARACSSFSNVKSHSSSASWSSSMPAWLFAAVSDWDACRVWRALSSLRDGYTFGPSPAPAIPVLQAWQLRFPELDVNKSLARRVSGPRDERGNCFGSLQQSKRDLGSTTYSNIRWPSIMDAIGVDNRPKRVKDGLILLLRVILCAAICTNRTLYPKRSSKETFLGGFAALRQHFIAQHAWLPT